MWGIALRPGPIWGLATDGVCEWGYAHLSYTPLDGAAGIIPFISVRALPDAGAQL